MAQDNLFIAVRSDKLSRRNDVRYVIKNRETNEIVDDGLGKGYKSPKAAHASFYYKQQWGNKKKRTANTPS